MVKDDAGNPVGGTLVLFTAPTSGPSGNFAGGLTDSSRTSASGEATSSTFTANFVAGSFTVVASTETGKTVTLHLTNTPGPLSRFAIETERGGHLIDAAAGVNMRIGFWYAPAIHERSFPFIAGFGYDRHAVKL